MEKISVIDTDPFIIPQPKYPPEDVSCYLETCFHTVQYEGKLQEFHKLICVHGVGVYYSFLEQIIRDKYVVLARVRYSQRVNDPRVQSNSCVSV